MTDQGDGAWRDEDKLPLSELNRAMATWDTDGQGEDTGNDVGAEQAGPTRRDPDADDPDRPVRPGTTGHTGPN